jgi:hypothetical protein
MKTEEFLKVQSIGDDCWLSAADVPNPFDELTTFSDDRPTKILLRIEADCYDLLSRLVKPLTASNTAQFTFASDLVERLRCVLLSDESRHTNDKHHDACGVCVLNLLNDEQEMIPLHCFAFRWSLLLTLPGLTTEQTMTLWINYRAMELADERHSFADNHVYVCAALLISLYSQLKNMSHDQV